MWPKSNSVETPSLRTDILGPIAENFFCHRAFGDGTEVSGVADFSEGFLFFAFFGFSVVAFGPFFTHLIGL